MLHILSIVEGHVCRHIYRCTVSCGANRREGSGVADCERSVDLLMRVLFLVTRKQELSLIYKAVDNEACPQLSSHLLRIIIPRPFISFAMKSAFVALALFVAAAVAQTTFTIATPYVFLAFLPNFQERRCS